ncbi:Nramp family divalent metal transporter [Halospeciosus flavus]|uniref:Nramp family divalent metal transporter n=1 Tax=Halospeciosus flavus TaxID=3032283 RepID=A0ABD5Z991_9EURY|nr:Nramp family divalent metal transporter [Halospeciosus flavus]
MTDTNETSSDESEPVPDGGVADSDVFMSEEQGAEYRSTVYEDVGYDTLEEAPQTDEFPNLGKGPSLKKYDLPKVPKLSHLVGPSAIMLGASLGSGETMFWPTIIAQSGWALYWAFWVGVLTQFFINTELQRWTLATGESIFRAFDRMHMVWPWFFLAAGFFQAGWPGWAAGASKVAASWAGLGTGAWPVIGIITMIVIWLSYQAGPVVYNIVETTQTVLMILAVVFAVILVFLAGTIGQLANVPAGAVSFGTLPADMNIAVFLGGLAYAGAGGYVNLAQGVWAREKGYGMGTYQGRIQNPLRGSEPEEVTDGYTFEPNEKNLTRWKAWWKVAQQEHFLSFVVGLLVVATIAMTISAEYAAGTEVGAIDMWLTEIIPALSPIAAQLTYAVIFIALFSTQYAIIESYVRNSVDIMFEGHGRQAGWEVSRVFLGFLTLYTVWGIAIIGGNLLFENFSKPWILLVIGAAAAGAMMWPYNALTTILNTKYLPEHTQMGWARIVAMWWATGFFGYFTVLLVGGIATGDQYGINFAALDTTVGIVGSGPLGYVLWVVFAIVQVYVMYVSGKAKLESQGTVEGADKARGLLS